ncbi:MAG: nitroreductase family protein [Deltaproteobacteria bacterium]|nr:nitroreductase family protein [Deltaproteobacteria bacterium]
MQVRPFSRSALELIAERCSHRTYDGASLDPQLRARLVEALESPPGTPFGNEVRLELVESFDARARGVRLGTYGMIQGARDFIVGGVRPGARDMEDFGFVFELAVLQATDLGLGTCWLGGTLKRGAFAEAAGLPEEMIVPAVSPVGRVKARRSLVDSATRALARSSKRKAPSELFFEGSFDRPLDAGGELAQVLAAVRLAPSASNRQPWRTVRAGDGALHFFVRRTPGYASVTAVDLQRIDMGIAMCHFQLAAGELGLEGGWTEMRPEGIPLPPRVEYAFSWRPGPGA